MLPDGVQSPAELEGEWHIARVRGLYERKIAFQLQAIGVGYFMPMERVRTKDAAGKRRESMRLICPSYLFVCCQHEDDVYEITEREGVLGLPRKVNDQQQLIGELVGFSIAAERNLFVDSDAEKKPGKRCRVIRGPLVDQEAWIEKGDGTNKKGMVSLNITILGRSAPTSVPIEDVELI